MLREAHIYLTHEKEPGVVAAMHHNLSGICYEQEEPLVVTEWQEPTMLAGALRAALERFSPRDRNLRDYKSTEWPSFRASHCRSVREFESIYLCIFVRAVNDAELFYDAYAQPHNESDITPHVTLNRYRPDDEMGRLLLRLFDVCSRWRSHAA